LENAHITPNLIIVFAMMWKQMWECVIGQAFV